MQSAAWGQPEDRSAETRLPVTRFVDDRGLLSERRLVNSGHEFLRKVLSECERHASVG